MKSIHEATEKDLGGILNHLNVGVYVTDTDRRIVFWNRRAEQITGFRAQEVVGHRCSANILRHRDKMGHSLCASDLCPLYRSIVRRTPSESPILVYAMSKEGRNLALSVSTAPLIAEDGQVIGGVEVFQDEGAAIQQMELARSVQRQMLTEALPVDDRVSFAVQYVPKELVSGDFYHVRRLSADQFIVFLADAAGHGVSAALSTALIYSLLLECQGSAGDPVALMTQINERACGRAPGLGFFTAVCIVLDAEQRTAAFCSAGHLPLLRQEAAGTVKALTGSQLPIGISASATYEGASVCLERGDRLLAYSDGATDIPTGGDARLGTEGLRALVTEHTPTKDPDMRELFDALMRRCTAVEPEDDITLVSCIFR